MRIFGIALYVSMLIVVSVIKGLSEDIGEDKVARRKFGLGLLTLVVFAFLPLLIKLLGGKTAYEALAALTGAAVIAIASHKLLSLEPEYLLKAKKAPRLLTESEKYLLKIAVSECVILMAVSFRKWLPKNVLTDMKQMTCYAIGLVRENIPMTIIVGGGLAVLLYYLFK